jgi:hypothetical protein
MTPQEVINEIQRQLTDLKYNEGEYCLIVYKTYDMQEIQAHDVHRIYKTFSALEQNISNDLKEIPKHFGVDVDIWQFD